MKNYLFSVLIIALSCTGAVNAAERPSNPKYQTSWDLYLDAAEAYDMKTSQADKVLFVDVRDPIEIMFTGFTDVVDINIPFMQPNRSRWNDKKSVFLMETNPNFEADIASALAARGLDKDTPVILMCRSGGARGAPSSKMLEGKGYKSVYVVVDGFEGSTVKQGKDKNWRRVNGWKNSGLPWSYKLNKDKMYMPN